MNKRKGVCREAGAGHKEESFTREQRMGFYSPDFHRNGARGVAWRCTALLGIAQLWLGFGARRSGFPSWAAAEWAQAAAEGLRFPCFLLCSYVGFFS